MNRQLSVLCCALSLSLVAVAVHGTPAHMFAGNLESIPTMYLAKGGSIATPQYKILSQADAQRYPTAGFDVVALGKYNNSHLQIGWDYLLVEPKDEFKGTAEGYFYGGYLEGYLTAHVMSYTNWTGLEPTDKKIAAWINEHMAYIQKHATAQAVMPFWQQIYRHLQQMEGIVAGYNAVHTDAKITMRQLFLNALQYEIGDIQLAVTNGKFIPPSGLTGEMGFHCSALIKFTDNDMFMAHDTWTGYTNMVRRIFKVYKFGPTVTLSSFPGQIMSGDDWYMTSNDIAIQETTNFVFDIVLYKYTVPETVSEFLRVMGASFTATNGEEWTRFFAYNNSGTYNNQYMVVDWKLYTPKQPIQDGTLWVAEQIPGYVERGDQSDVLRKQGYWASYNIAYYKHIYDVSGYARMEREQGSIWNYSTYARPEIFRHHQGGITNLTGMKTMMRYNHYKTDRFSLIPNCTGTPGGKCDPPYSAMLSIASRGDLNPPRKTSHYGPLVEWVDQTFGAIDSKIAAWSTRKSLTGYVISGPTADTQPAFNWKTSPYPERQPKDSVDEYDFPWCQFEGESKSGKFAFPSAPYHKSGSSADHAVAIGVSCAVVGLVLLAVGVFMLRRDPHGPFRSDDDSIAEGPINESTGLTSGKVSSV